MYRADTSQRYAVGDRRASPQRAGGRGAAWTEERATREGGASRAPVGEQEAQRGPGRGSARARFRRNLSGMRRSVVDYGLARRATLASVFSGRTTVTDV